MTEMNNHRNVLCTFLREPKKSQIRQIIGLYQAQGWWQEEDDEAKAHVIPRLITGSHCFLVAMDEDGIIGMGRAISDGVSDAYVQDLTVRKDRRGKGIATMMLKTILERLHADGITWIGLIAEPGSANLYHRAGFTRMSDSTPMVLITKK